MSAATVACALFCCIAATPQQVNADEIVIRKPVKITVERGWVQVSVGFRELFDNSLKKQLQSGFPLNITMRAYLYPEKSDRPIALGLQSYRVVYDLWGEVYVLRRESMDGNQHVSEKNTNRTIDFLTSFWRFPLVHATLLKPAQSYFMVGLIDVNPINPEIQREIRRWLRSPYPQQRTLGGNSFFGSFVSIFVNPKEYKAERSFRFVTPSFRIPQRQISPQ